MHEFLIILVILAVVAIQFFVGFSAWKKIDLYKEIIPSGKNFQTLKVYIREDQVKDIDINYVLNNPHKFGAPVLLEQSEPVYAEVISTVIDSSDAISADAVVASEGQEEEIGYEDLIWVARGNEEMKIKYKLLRSHEQAGWTRI